MILAFANFGYSSAAMQHFTRRDPPTPHHQSELEIDMQAYSAPDLVADIGGTNARFALLDTQGQCYAQQSVICNDFPNLAAAAQFYLQSVDNPRPRRAAMAVATQPRGDWITFPNNDKWKFSTEDTRRALGLEQLILLNDFTALALALPLLQSDERYAVGGGTAVAGEPIALIGPGTGLGISGLVWSGQRWIPLETEGGHTTISPTDEREWSLISILQRRFGHVSPERLLSGPGLLNLYQGLAELEGWTAQEITPAEITQRALEGSCRHCRAVLDLFYGALATAASNLAITLGARGGVYIGGGILPRLCEDFARSNFRTRFEAKGRFSDYMAQIPTWIITANDPALRGVAVALA